MPSPQERVYGVLDIITKPIQWFIGGLQVLGFLLLVAVVAIVTPVYHLVTTGAASSTEIEVALFVLGLIILFFAAPWYTVLGGTALLATVFFYAAFNPDPPAPSYELVRNVLWGFLLVGFLWVGAKRSRRNKVYADPGKPTKGTDRGRAQASRPQRNAAPKSDHSEGAKRANAPDYYRVLGLQNGATKEEIKQAYRDLVKVWHPDRFSADDERLRRMAEAKLKEINEAHGFITAHGAPVSNIDEMDVNDATQYITAITRNVNGEVEDFVRRVKAGEFADYADALKAFECMVPRVEEVSAKFNDVVERIRRDVPDATANAQFIQLQQTMNQVAECIRQMKEHLERQ